MSLYHWADMTADRIIRQKGDKPCYVVASGITPSGTVHFGNFREVITVDLVARGLRSRGKEVRFIFSWDDFDTFRKVPKNLPNPKEFEKYLFKPIVDTPSPDGKAESYAAYHESNFESQLSRVGVDVEFLYQSKKYRAGEYEKGIRNILKNREKIVAILNEHRTKPLAKDWWPVSVYCENCGRDRLKACEFNGKDAINYECELCGHKGTEVIEGSSRAKLPWRVDWPMRWDFEKVDFEPGGKDHSSEGGSYTTAKVISKEIFDFDPPVYLQYDFVSIKGRGGKMSSSSGEVVTLSDVLEIYEPEIVRWIFASYKTNVDFSVSFDLDVIKIYEDFDRMERLSFGLETANEKKTNIAKRVYELSQIDKAPTECPYQPSFRHLCNVLQIFEGDLKKTHEYYSNNIKTKWDERRFENRSRCAWTWIKKYAPEDFQFGLRRAEQSVEKPNDPKILAFLTSLKATIESEFENFEDDTSLHNKIYELMHAQELKPGDIFPWCYRLLIQKEKGPKLASFMRVIGREKLLELFSF